MQSSGLINMPCHESDYFWYELILAFYDTITILIDLVFLGLSFANICFKTISFYADMLHHI